MDHRDVHRVDLLRSFMRRLPWRDVIVERVQTFQPVRSTQGLEITTMLDGVRPEYVKTCEINQWRLHMLFSATDEIPPILRLTACPGNTPLIGQRSTNRFLRWNLYG